jgi:hypothetical protein
MGRKHRERQRTNRSLRVERGKTDSELAVRSGRLMEDADSIVAEARRLAERF